MTERRGAPGTAGAFDKALLDAAMATHYDDICGAVRRRGLEPGLASEVVHDLYVRLSGRREPLAGKRSLRAFLMRAAVNLGIDRLRRQAFETRLFRALDAEAERMPARVPSAEQHLEAVQRLHLLQEAIAALPRQCRTVFIAHRIGDFSKDEIAESLGIKRRMVDRHLRKATLACLERLEVLE